MTLRISYEHTGCFKKKVRMFVCLISPKPINRFLNRFFFWKLRSICKFWIQNQLCAMFRGWDIHKTKRSSGKDKYIFKLTWSCPHSTRVVLRLPDWLQTGLIITSESLRGPRLPQLVFQGVSGPLSGQSGHLKGTTRGWSPTKDGHPPKVKECSDQETYFAKVA